MFRCAVISLAVILAAGCGKKEEPGFLEGAQQSATDSATHPGSPGGTAIVPDVAAGTTVLVTLADNRIAVTNADQIPPGPAVFTINNASSEVHNLHVEGPGVSVATDDATISGGATTSIEATLQPGTYTLYCPIAGHRDRGESLQLIIKPAGAPAPTSTVVPTPTTTS